jgi:hypothetical protein
MDYSRSRHTHPDEVRCAEAGDEGHPPRTRQPELIDAWYASERDDPEHPYGYDGDHMLAGSG